MNSYSVIVALILSILIPGCGGGGGSNANVRNSDAFVLVGVNLSHGVPIAINQPIEMQFNQPVDLNTVDLASTISITGRSRSSTIPVVPPVQGTFSLKPGSGGSIVVFQPKCPTNSDNDDGGLIPSDDLGQVEYSFSILDTDNSQPHVIRSTSGTRLSRGLTFGFRTYHRSNPFLDPVPQNPPQVSNAAEIPATLELNLLTQQLSPIQIELDQPVKANRFAQNWFRLRYEDTGSPGSYIPIPTTLALVENCGTEAGSTFLLTVQGILPSNTVVELIESEEIQGFGDSDFNLQDLVVKRMQVVEKSPTQKDAWIESFDDDSEEDTSTATNYPRAVWGQGSLLAASPFAAESSQKDIRIGVGFENGYTVTVDTTSSFLIATDGTRVPIVNGRLVCRDFTMRRDTAGSRHSVLTGLGDYPLQIFATGTVTFERDTVVRVIGGESPGVVTVGSGNVSESGAFGRCGGGDGGDASTVAVGSTASGSDGNGPLNTPGHGGKGGHSGYGGQPNRPDECTHVQFKGAGGGGGHFIDSERDGGVDGPFQYGRYPILFSTGCITGSMVTGANNPPCNGAQPATNTTGEAGKDSFTGIGTDTISINANFDPQIVVYDAVTNQPGPRGGAIGDPVFVDGDSTNNFFGTKILPGGVPLVGELILPIGGSGGGGGGDAIGSVVFPPPGSHDYIGDDFKGAGGGGGGGCFRVLAIGRILVNGEINADGGDGGKGETVTCIAQSGGGSGGGAGGMIILESLTGITLGETTSDRPRLHANGGDRGYGTSLLTAATGTNERCAQDLVCLGGVTNWVTCCAVMPGHSKRNATKCTGGAGGKGMIILGVPHNDDGTLKTDALKSLTTGNSAPYTIAGPVDMGITPCASSSSDDCFEASSGTLHYGETSNNAANFRLYPRMDPDPHIIEPSFGPKSVGLTQWRYLGAATSSFTFGGTDGSGALNLAAAETVLASASSGATIEGATQARIVSSALYSAVVSNPKVLIGAQLKPNSSSSRFTIDNAELISGTTNTVRIYTDSTDGTMSSADSWQLIERYYEVVTSGTRNTLPSNSSIKIEFQGAGETSTGSGVVDSSSISPSSTSFTNDPSTLNGKKFIRSRITFNLLESGTPDASLIGVSRPELRQIKVPFTF